MLGERVSISPLKAWDNFKEIFASENVSIMPVNINTNVWFVTKLKV